MSLIKDDSSLTVSSSSSCSLVMKAPKSNDITFFNDAPPSIDDTEQTVYIKSHSEAVSLAKKAKKVKKKVTFPENVIKDYSDPPKLGWIPGCYPTSDLVEAYMKSCEIHKCKSLGKLVQQLKALQDIDCSNGEKVNVLNLKSERIDSKQIETLEEIFKRLSFKTIDLENTMLEDESCASTLFEIIGYYDTVERLILANIKNAINLTGWQELSKYIRKASCLEYLDLRGHHFGELIFFTYLARSIKLTTTLKVIHLENSNISGRYLLMLAAALKDNEQIKEVYLGDNKLQSNDGNTIATIIKENRCLEVLDLRNNHLQDIGLSYICSGLSEQASVHEGLRIFVILNNNITAHGISYLSKALIHNRSLTTLNIAQNSLTNEAIFELKEALIVNKQICSLFLNKTKLSDEGIIALAEYIAETTSLIRLDLRENDIKLGGLMALVSSLKFNNTLSRLDVDRDTRRDHFFHISFQLKDSVETSKRLLQDLNDYCMRNQRNQTALEAKRAEERRLLQIENEKQLLELVKEINTQAPCEQKVDDISSNLSNQSLPQIVIDDTNTHKSLQDQLGDVDQYNNSHGFTKQVEKQDFQLIEGVEEESTETDYSDMVIIENETESYQANRLATINQSQLDLDVLSVVNSLIEKVILNTKLLEAESVQLIHQNSSTLSMTMSESNSTNDLTRFFDFNDSNDLSASIEPENSQLDDGLLDTNNNSKLQQLNDSSIIEEDESCNDSDIEVLAISKKLVNDVVSTSVKMNKDSCKALLTSITEQEVNTLITKQEESETWRIMKSTPIKQKQNEENNSSLSDTSLILSTSPFNQFSAHEQETNLSPADSLTDTTHIKSIDPSNRPFFASKMTSSQISEELSNEIAFERE